MNRNAKRMLWPRWLVANGLGEMLGLGLTFAVGALHGIFSAAAGWADKNQFTPIR